MLPEPLAAPCLLSLYAHTRNAPQLFVPNSRRRMACRHQRSAMPGAVALACLLAVAAARQMPAAQPTDSQPATRLPIIVARGPSYKNDLVYVPNT